MKSPTSNDEIIQDVIAREGSKLINVAGDNGGLTFEGISIKSNPDLFQHGVPTHEQVQQRYLEKYVVGPGFDKIPDMKLRSLLVDFGVLSGPFIAIQALQGVVGTTPDGVLGNATLSALAGLPVEKVINGVVAARIRMIGRILSKNPSQVKFAPGWLNRCVEWLG